MISFFRKSNRPIRIEKVQKKTHGHATRVSSKIDGRTIWFESSDIDLAASPEAFGSAMLIPALELGRTLAVDDKVCRSWAENIEVICPIVSKWWGYGPRSFDMKTEKIDAPDGGAGTSLCFSGGVDSFYTLLHGPRQADSLVCAIGYDVMLKDAGRIAQVDRSVRDVAEECGAKPILIATNIRSHRTFRKISWERSHGGALAALGHLLADNIGMLEISSSHPFVNFNPWGSSWKIDPYFSSDRVAIDHIGAEHWRSEKLRRIADESIVARHLRVCWKNLNSRFNCCRCEKCIRTMCILETCGQLEQYDCFEHGRGLCDIINQAPPMEPFILYTYELLLEDELKRKTKEAVRHWLERSRTAIAGNNAA